MVPRLFVALDPPDTMADALLAIMGGITGARWQRRDQLHLTLDFMGDVDRQRISDLVDHLARVRHAPIALRCAGLGHFARSGSPIALWAAAEPADSLAQLAAKTRRAVAAAGVTSQAMPFVPHITIARLNRSSRPIADFLKSHAGFACGGPAVCAFGLYASTLGAEGSRYELIRSFPLGN